MLRFEFSALIWTLTTLKVWLASSLIVCQASATQERRETPLSIPIKYFSYTKKNGRPVVGRQQAAKALESVNKIWSQCKIKFQLSDFVSINPSRFGFVFNTLNLEDLNKIREKLDDGTGFNLIVTGPWDRKGTLGKTKANAWTNMPAEPVKGTIIEESLGTDAILISHEFGHYLNLDDVDDKTNVMSSITDEESVHLTDEQCVDARTSFSETHSAR